LVTLDLPEAGKPAAGWGRVGTESAAPLPEPHGESEFVNTGMTFRPIFKLTFFLYY
jgi:hypothetical protein